MNQMPKDRSPMQSSSRMFQHRKLFMSLWLLGAVALVFFPGYECKAFFIGMTGWCPLLYYSKVHPFVILALSPLLVGLCAWAMDKARLTKILWLILLFALFAGAGIGFWYQQDRFNDFCEMQLYPSKGPPTQWSFYRCFIIPSMVACSMWGLYATALVGLLSSGTAILLRKRALAVRAAKPEI